MKWIRILAICLFALFISMKIVHAQLSKSITVTSPKAGETFKLGDTMIIAWNYSESQAATQKWGIELARGNEKFPEFLGVIADHVSGNRYSWSVGKFIKNKYGNPNVTPGSDYRISFYNYTSRLWVLSDTFSIVFSPIVQKIQPLMKPPKLELVSKRYTELEVRERVAPGKLEGTKPDLKCQVVAYYDKSLRYAILPIAAPVWNPKGNPEPLREQQSYIYFLASFSGDSGKKYDKYLISTRIESPYETALIGQEWIEREGLFKYRFGPFNIDDQRLNGNTVTFTADMDITQIISETNEMNNRCMVKVKFAFP